MPGKQSIVSNGVFALILPEYCPGWSNKLKIHEMNSGLFQASSNILSIDDSCIVKGMLAKFQVALHAMPDLQW